MKRFLFTACLFAGVCGAIIVARPATQANFAKVPAPSEADILVSGTKSPSSETLTRVQRDLARTQQRLGGIKWRHDRHYSLRD